MTDALQRIGVPTRAEVAALSSRVETLTERVNALLAKLDGNTASESSKNAI